MNIPTPKEFATKWAPRMLKRRKPKVRKILRKARRTLRNGYVSFSMPRQDKDIIEIAETLLLQFGWRLDSKPTVRQNFDIEDKRTTFTLVAQQND